MVAETIPLTPSDSMDLMGFLILPEAAVLYSHINLPATSILKKTQLNQLQFNYWSALTRSTPVNIKTISRKSGFTIYIFGRKGNFSAPSGPLKFAQMQNFDDRRPDTLRKFLNEPNDTY